MRDLQEIYFRLQEKKKKVSELKQIYKEYLLQSEQHKEISDKLKQLREKKKQIENGVKEELAAEFDQIEKLTLDINSDNEMLSDIALNQIAKGESISILDDYDNELEPIVSVKFRKVK